VVLIDGDPDDQAVVRRICAAGEDFRLCGCFQSTETALARIEESGADLALVDFNLPDRCGIRCVQGLHGARPGLRIALLCGLPQKMLVDRAFDVGIAAMLAKPLDFSQTLTTLRFLASGLVPAQAQSGSGGASLRGCDPSSKQAGGTRALLTARECEVLRWLAEGLLYKEIEDRMKISHAMLRKLQHRIFVKLGAHNRTEAVNCWRMGRAPAAAG
jgi:DNA-binding NarL/FixJ family response regulator